MTDRNSAPHGQLTKTSSGIRSTLTAALLGTTMALAAVAAIGSTTSGAAGAVPASPAAPALVVATPDAAPAAQLFGSDDLLGVAAARTNGRVSTSGVALTVRKGPSSTYARCGPSPTGPRS